MGKIIINNKSRLSDEMALEKVIDIVKKGYVSKIGGLRTYCALTRPEYIYESLGGEIDRFFVDFACRPNKYGAHTFTVCDVSP